MTTQMFGRINLVGGTESVDNIPYDNLNDEDLCIVINSSKELYYYRFNSSSNAAEDSPNIITPDDQTGNGRWELISSNILEKSRMTAIGGFAVKLTNKTGVASVAGKLVEADSSNDDAVELCGTSDTECIGVFLDSGVADGDEAWIVMGGIADVAFEDNHGPTHGYWVATSATDAGYAVDQASPAAAPTHFREIGHCIETVTAGGGGTHVLARCVLHFN